MQNGEEIGVEFSGLLFKNDLEQLVFFAKIVVQKGLIDVGCLGYLTHPCSCKTLLHKYSSGGFQDRFFSTFC